MTKKHDAKSGFFLLVANVFVIVVNLLVHGMFPPKLDFVIMNINKLI